MVVLVPAKLPECPGGKCICSFFWIHKADSGGEESEYYKVCFLPSNLTRDSSQCT